MKKEKLVCEHEFQTGYTLDLVVFCVKCNKDADEIYLGMPFVQQLKLTKIFNKL